jgi:hypothetical protein
VGDVDLHRDVLAADFLGEFLKTIEAASADNQFAALMGEIYGQRASDA